MFFPKSQKQTVEYKILESLINSLRISDDSQHPKSD